MYIRRLTRVFIIASILLLPFRLLAESVKLSRDPLTGNITSVALDTVAIDKILSTVPQRAQAASSDRSLLIAGEFVSRYKALFGLRDVTSKMSLKRTEKDQLGFTHLRYGQYFKGLPVFGRELTVHMPAKNKSLVASGKISAENYSAQNIVLTSADAKERAHEIWQQLFGTDPQILTEPELKWLDPSISNPTVSAPLRRSWIVKARSKVPLQAYMLFIDAENGELLWKLSLIKTELTRYSFDCADHFIGDLNCDLDYYDSTLQYTFGRSEGQPARGPNPNKSSYSSDQDNLYTYLGDTYNYFLQRHGRDGANNSSGIGEGTDYSPTFTVVYSFAEEISDDYYLNAAYLGESMVFGTGNVTLDIVGHEYAHAVTHHSAEFIYENEPGALDESFADIFGEAIEYYANGENDWLQGVDSITGAIRNMSDPTSIPDSPIFGPLPPQPDKLHSVYTYCGLEDAGGVHTNSGILNHAAYLLAMGGTFNGCDITGLRREKQENIFYRALNFYLISTSGYSDVYLALKNACADLYSSEECLEVEKALNAVQLNQISPCFGGEEIDPGAGCLDSCPADSSKLSPGLCGCGMSDDDGNFNNVADCLDPDVAGVTPPAPTLRRAKRSITINMTPLEGVSYDVKVVSIIPPAPGKRQRRITKNFASTSAQLRVTGLKSGSIAEVTYVYVLDGTPITYSNESSKRRVKLK